MSMQTQLDSRALHEVRLAAAGMGREGTSFLHESVGNQVLAQREILSAQQSATQRDAVMPCYGFSDNSVATAIREIETVTVGPRVVILPRFAGILVEHQTGSPLTSMSVSGGDIVSQGLVVRIATIGFVGLYSLPSGVSVSLPLVQTAVGREYQLLLKTIKERWLDAVGKKVIVQVVVQLHFIERFQDTAVVALAHLLGVERLDKLHLPVHPMRVGRRVGPFGRRRLSPNRCVEEEKEEKNRKNRCRTH